MSLIQYIQPPDELPAYPDARKVKPKTHRSDGGLRVRWKDEERIFEWDYQHGKVEVYNLRGHHLGEFDPMTGQQTKPSIPNRRVQP